MNASYSNKATSTIAMRWSHIISKTNYLKGKYASNYLLLWDLLTQNKINLKQSVLICLFYKQPLLISFINLLNMRQSLQRLIIQIPSTEPRGSAISLQNSVRFLTKSLFCQ